MGTSDSFHTPVLLKEVIEGLRIKKGKRYIDATVGGGGYTREILSRGGYVLGIDQDPDAINYVEENFKFQISNFKLILVQGNFRDIKEIAEKYRFGKVEGIVFDVGLSSYQIGRSGRGFSFQKDEPLDMRMDRAGRVTAADLVNNLRKEELYELFSKMGEEQFSRAIIHHIIRARRIKPIEGTGELTKIIEESVPHTGNIHPATRVFQALRIAVNKEIINLKMGIRDGFELLEKSGRMAVVSFHSLEDRVIKIYFRELEQLGKGIVITKKPITPSLAEISKNRRSRSAKLRVIEKV